MMNGIEAKTGPEVKILQGILPERDSDVDEDWRGQIMRVMPGVGDGRGTEFFMVIFHDSRHLDC